MTSTWIVLRKDQLVGSFQEALPSTPSNSAEERRAIEKLLLSTVKTSRSLTDASPSGAKTPDGGDGGALWPPHERYRLLELLGAGAGGEVYLAHDRYLDRQVAFKWMRSAGVDALRVDQEIRLLATLEHDHIVRLYDAGQLDRSSYMVMEYVRGMTLDARLLAGRPTQVEAVQITFQILEALRATHALGIVHRDLKPANIFIETGGRVRVGDFGLAFRTIAPADAVPVPTDSIHIVGTPAYMSPEQTRNISPGPASDVFSTGTILWEMLTGQRLFCGKNLAAVLMAHSEPQLVRRLAEVELPAGLAGIVHWALSFRPEDRPSVSELATALATWMDRVLRRRRSPASVALPRQPYRLLQAFDGDESELFHGREEEVEDLLELLRQEDCRLLLVFGQCGVGKSSLLKAGLLPRLAEDSKCGWVVQSGADPTESVLRWAVNRYQECHPQAAPAEIPREISALLRGAAQSGPCALIIDHIEEIFTLNEDPTLPASGLFCMVEEIVRSDLPIQIILAFREEHLGKLHSLQSRLAGSVCIYQMRDMSTSGLVSAIEAPADLGSFGFRFATGVAARLAAAILKTSTICRDSALATMQIVCHELYERCKSSPRPAGTGCVIIDSAMIEGDSGGVEGALVRHFERQLSHPAYADGAGLARQILHALTIKEDGGKRNSLPRNEEELLDFPDRTGARCVLEQLIRDHLVVREPAEDGHSEVRLISDAVCTVIDGWVMEPVPEHQAARLLRGAYRIWSDQQQQSEHLLRGDALQVVQKYRAALIGLTSAESAFLAASERAYRRHLTGRLSAAILVISLFFCAGFLRPGRIRVHCPYDGLQLTIGLESRDDIVASATLPLTGPIELSPGRYRIRVEADNFHIVEQTLAVERGSTYDLSFSPERITHLWNYPVGSAPITSGVLDRSGHETSGVPDAILATANGTLLRVSGLSCTRLWGNRTPARKASNPPRLHTPLLGHNLVHGTRVIIIAESDGTIYSCCGTHGDTRWSLNTRLRLSQPVLVNGRHGGDDVMFAAADSGQVIAVETGSGKLLWTVQVNAVGPVAAIDAGSQCIVLVATERGRLEGLSCHDGRRIWSISLSSDIASVPLTSTEPEVPDPIAAVYCKNGDLYGICATSGQLRWSRRVGPGLDFSPEVHDLDGDGIPDMVGSRAGQVVAFGGRDGGTLWQYDSRTPMAGRPTFSDPHDGDASDVLFTDGDGHVVALAGRDGRRLWRFNARALPQGLLLAGTGTLDGFGRVFVGSAHNRMSCLHPGGPKTLQLLAPVPGVSSVPCLADLDQDGVMDVIPNAWRGTISPLSGRTGLPLWTASAGEESAAVPVVGELRDSDRPDLLLRTDPGKIVAFDGRTGTRIWTSPTGVNFESPPCAFPPFGPFACAVAGTSSDGRLRVLSGASGVELYSFPVPCSSHLLRIADFDGDGTPDVLVASTDGRIRAIGRSLTAVLWTVDAPVADLTNPVLADLDGDGILDVVAVSPESSVVAVSGRTGRISWKRILPEGLYLEPVLGDVDGDGHADAVVASKSGRVLAIDGKTGMVRWSRDLPGPLSRAPLLEQLDGEQRLDVVINSRFMGIGLSGRTGRIIRRMNSYLAAAAPTFFDLHHSGAPSARTRGVLAELPHTNHRLVVQSSQGWITPRPPRSEPIDTAGALAPTWRTIGNDLWEQSLDDAAAAYREALLTDPADWKARIYLCMAVARAEDPRLAADTYIQALFGYYGASWIRPSAPEYRAGLASRGTP